MCLSQPSDRGARVELADIIIIIILLFHFIIGFLAKLWPNIRPYLGLLKYLIVSLDRSPILLRVISWLHKVANYFKWILSIPNNQLTFSQRSECKLEESVYDKWLLTIFVSCYPLIPQQWQQQWDTVCSQAVSSGPHHGNPKTNHQCKHQPPLSNWRISCWD